MGDAEERDEPDSEAEFVPGNAWDAWMAQAVKSVVRARLIAKTMRILACVAAGVAVLGMVATYWVFFRGTFVSFDLEGFHKHQFDSFLQATALSAGIGLGAFTSVALLLGGSAVVDLYAQRLDLSIIEADDEGDIE